MFSVEDVEDNGGVDALPLSERARFRTVADVGRGKLRKGRFFGNLLLDWTVFLAVMDLKAADSFRDDDKNATMVKRVVVLGVVVIL
mmetsp:Transcript_30689/g.61153  ORF Transcript_30689/g.61153 Transcript_30689/m.61153 type:complete len:86 (-) Transcript_30689:93-350(-)